MFAECIKAVRALPASVVMYRIHETMGKSRRRCGQEGQEGVGIKNIEGRGEKEERRGEGRRIGDDAA